jgi:glycerol uptake facilitator-like aquaporin
MSALAHRAVAECLGTAFLLAGVVGSGIMAAKLAGGNGALALAIATSIRCALQPYQRGKQVALAGAIWLVTANNA